MADKKPEDLLRFFGYNNYTLKDVQSIFFFHPDSLPRHGLVAGQPSAPESHRINRQELVAVRRLKAPEALITTGGDFHPPPKIVTNYTLFQYPKSIKFYKNFT